MITARELFHGLSIVLAMSCGGDSDGRDGGGGDGATGADSATSDGPMAGNARLVVATYIGDPGSTNANANQSARNVLFSSAGDIVVSGLGGQDAPVTAGAYQIDYAGDSNLLGGDCWIGRLSADLSNLTAATLYGGEAEERPCYGLAERADGSIVIGGVTRSATGIASAGTLQANNPAANSSGFVAVLSADLTTRLAGSYVGGPDDASLRGGVRIHSTGSIMAFGQVDDGTLTTVGAYQQQTAGGLNEGWVGLLSTDLTTLEWGTFVGGNSTNATEVVIGTGDYADGDVALYSSSPSTAWLQGVRTHGSLPGAGNRPFVARLVPSAPQTLEWVTVLGPGDGATIAGVAFQEAGLAMDSSEAVYVAGVTEVGYGTAGAYQVGPQGSSDCFVCKVAATGDLEWCTNISTTGLDYCISPVVSASGRVMVAGQSDGSICDGADATLETTPVGGLDGFVAVLSPDGARLEWCTLFGGGAEDKPRFLARHPDGRVVVSGMTRSDDLVGTAGGYDSTANGNEDMFVALFADIPFD